MTGYRHTAQALQKPTSAKGDPVVRLTTKGRFDGRIISSKRTLGKITLPSNVVRICRAADFRMTNYFYRSHIDQIDDISPTALFLSGCKEGPLSVSNGSEIAISNPLGLFSLVPSFSPYPEIVEDAGINIAEGFLGARMTVIVGPTTDHWVELSQHFRCCATKMEFDDFLCFGNNAFH